MAISKGTIQGVFEDLDTQLNKVSGIQFVDWQRTYESGVTPEMYPGIFINYIRSDKTRLLEDVVKTVASFGLVLFVWASENENLGTKINTFIESVKDKILADPTRNSNAYNTTVDVVELDSGSRHPQGLAIMMLTVTMFTDE